MFVGLILDVCRLLWRKNIEIIIMRRRRRRMMVMVMIVMTS